MFVIMRYNQFLKNTFYKNIICEDLTMVNNVSFICNLISPSNPNQSSLLDRLYTAFIQIIRCFHYSLKSFIYKFRLNSSLCCMKGLLIIICYLMADDDPSVILIVVSWFIRERVKWNLVYFCFRGFLTDAYEKML